MTWGIKNGIICAAEFNSLVEELKLKIKKIYQGRKEKMKMLFICYPKCTTCQKAKKWLDDNCIEYTERNIKEENPTAEELKKWYKISGLPLSKFFNTSGLLYKSMGLKEKLPYMTDEEKLALLATDGMLVKRPLLITDRTGIPGFKESAWQEEIK